MLTPEKQRKVDALKHLLSLPPRERRQQVQRIKEVKADRTPVAPSSKK